MIDIKDYRKRIRRLLHRIRPNYQQWEALTWNLCDALEAAQQRIKELESVDRNYKLIRGSYEDDDPRRDIPNT